MELMAEDYKCVQIRDVERLYNGKSVLEVERPKLIDRLHSEGRVPRAELLETPPEANRFFILTSQRRSTLAWYDPDRDELESWEAAHT